ncbi:MAG: Nif3-like dinuclear metal center hexameric protein [Neisseria sp.]|nr:Nif3-like dinuclear metal center hexameric protein [Neisseria sp.]
MIQRQDLLNWLHTELAVAAFQDYAPNGLQVEGNAAIRKILCAVTASRAAIEAAIAAGADTLLVHHGMFWKSEPATIVGWKKERIRLLLAHDMNLLAYHLPLDAHPEWGNNAQLARFLGWQCDTVTGEGNLLWLGRTRQPQTLAELTQELSAVLRREPLTVGDAAQNIERIAWCSGGAQGFFQAAIDAGVQAFITGEASEAQYHLAQETGTAFIAAGHHATERYGVQALAAAVNRHFGIETVFFDQDNPV